MGKIDMARRRSEPRARQHGTAPKKKQIIIAMEGSETEPRYFDSLKSKLRSTNVTLLKRKRTRSSPSDVLKQLDREKRERKKVREHNAVIEYWAVIDKDNRPPEELNKIANHAKCKNYHLADSNPCFELWLLLHYKPLNQFSGLEASGDNSACSQVERQLEKLDRSYDKDKKGKLDTSKYMPIINTAIQNAKETDPQPQDRWLNRIGTRVYLLAQSIIDSSPSLRRIHN